MGVAAEMWVGAGAGRERSIHAIPPTTAVRMTTASTFRTAPGLCSVIKAIFRV
jgi:alpha-D-ribose 1-methylphosphonate 5-phosphate C-P lyase